MVMSSPVVGNFVGVDHPAWSNEPLIGEVVSMDDGITIEWWNGTYARRWVPEMVKQDGKTVPNRETIGEDQIVLNFKWPKADKMMLPKEIRERLKAAYAKLR